MRYGSLFSGVGGFDEGLDRAGWTCAFQVELDPFCQRVLAERWPDVERWADVRSVRGASGTLTDSDGAITQSSAIHSPGRQSIDLLVGGFPCQDLSVAGKRAGLVGERSGLFWEIVRIAHALRPMWGLFENVPGLLSSHGGRDMAAVLEGLRQCWPVVGYRVLDSQHFGVAQRRRRVFLVGGPTEAGVAEVLALTEGGVGDLAAGGEAGARVAATLVGGVAGARSHGKPSGSDRRELVIARCLAPGPNNQRFNADTDTFVAAQMVASGPPGTRREDEDSLVVTHALSAEGHDASEDGTGRGTPLVAFTERTRADGRNVEHQEDLAYSLNNPGAGGRTQENRIATSSMVRRLTPVECEKLQGFAPGWSCLCTPLAAYAADEDAAALACTCPDSPRYRALGNAVTVNVVEWLAHRLMNQVRA